MSSFNQWDIKPEILKIGEFCSGRAWRALGSQVPALKETGRQPVEIQCGSSSFKNTRGRWEGYLLIHLREWSRESGMMGRLLQEQRDKLAAFPSPDPSINIWPSVETSPHGCSLSKLYKPRPDPPTLQWIYPSQSCLPQSQNCRHLCQMTSRNPTNTLYPNLSILWNLSSYDISGSDTDSYYFRNKPSHTLLKCAAPIQGPNTAPNRQIEPLRQLD